MISIANNRITRDIQRQSNLANGIARTQTDISTVKKIRQPSDDPTSSARIASIRQSQSNNDAWHGNLQLGISLSDQAGGVMSVVIDKITHARELVVAGASGTTSAADRATLANELRSLSEELSSLAATKSSLGGDLFTNGTALKFRFSETDLVEPVPNKQDAFELNGVSLSQIVLDAANSLAAGTSAQTQQSLTALDGGINKAANSAADIGVKGSRMISIRERQIDEGIILTAERSGLEDTDLNEAIAQLNSQSLTLDAARAAFSRINRHTLFDFLN
jgi:flagellar hook-associated protein 3 FlgL